MKTSFFLTLFAVLALTYCTSKTEKVSEEDKEGHRNKINSDNFEDAAAFGENAAYISNVSQFGASKMETFMILNSPKGIRYEYNINRRTLQLWLNPLAGKSINYEDRNFSSRDDFMNIFDKIDLPKLNLSEFKSVDYDAFHSKIYFTTGQVMHMLTLADKAAVMLWFENPEVVDFKTNRSTTIVNRTATEFVGDYSERGKDFTFVAALTKGTGAFLHQLQVQKGRSTYSRANLSANQAIVIAGEVKSEKPLEFARKLASAPVESTVAANDKIVDAEMQIGKITLNGNEDLQKLIDVNKKFAFSTQDQKGLMRSSLQYIYFLIWMRDNGMNVNHLAASGWLNPTERSLEAVLKNPTVSLEDPKGIYYGQLWNNGPINKFEEDGLFYVILTAFVHWTQSGSDHFIKGEYLQTMEKSMDWLERYCYDSKKGLFGRYYYCENPFIGSRDFGWDNAKGNPVDNIASMLEKDTITRSYDLYMNMIYYNSYLMLSAFETGKKQEEYAAKAGVLAQNMKKFFKGEEMPLYGDLLTSDKRVVSPQGYALDRTDYIWGSAMNWLSPHFEKEVMLARHAVNRDLNQNPSGNFLAATFSLSRSLDSEFYPEDSILQGINYVIPQCVKPGKVLPMPYTICEIVDAADGHPYHDVRPIVFSIAPYIASVSNLGVRRLPFGLSVRANKTLKSITQYQYLGKKIDFLFEGSGAISKIEVNGKVLPNSYTIPENWLSLPANVVKVSMAQDAKTSKALIGGSIKLLDVGGNQLKIKGYGTNSLILKGDAASLKLKDGKGTAIAFKSEVYAGHTFVTFEGRGEYTVEL